MKVVLIKDDGTKEEYEKFILVGKNAKKNCTETAEGFTVNEVMYAAGRLQQEVLNHLDEIDKESDSNE